MSERPSLRVFLVEDEAGVALLIEDMLDELGCQVVASVARLPRAVEAARSLDFDLAILDVNVDGELVFPFAETLRERGIPMIFSTGYGAGGLPPAFQGHTVLAKPFSFNDLRVAIASIAARHGGD